MKKDFESVASILDNLIKKKNWEVPLSLERLKKEWEKIVGKNIAKHSFPTFIKNKKLYIEVDSPIWSNELIFQKENIITIINNYYKKEIIKDIFFKIKKED